MYKNKYIRGSNNLQRDDNEEKIRRLIKGEDLLSQFMCVYFFFKFKRIYVYTYRYMNIHTYT